MTKYILLITFSCMLVTGGCNEFGRVDQGRVIAYDQNEQTIVMLRDKSPDSKKPDYTELPPISYTLPSDPDETGPAPRTGKLMNINMDKKEVDIFIENTNTIATVTYTLVEEKKIDPKDPLVYDSQNQKTREFPLMDQNNKTITVFLEDTKTLITFSVPDEYFALPPDTWTMGDEVRMYYKEPGKALRFMNISKTDIFKK